MVDLKVGDIAIAPEGCKTWFTPNKEYQIEIVYQSGSFQVIADNKRLSFCLQTNCNHLNGQDWTFKTKTNS